MADTITLSEIQSRIRQRGEIRSAYVADGELEDMINASLRQLYRMIVDVNPDWYLSSNDITVSSGTSEYSLPADFYLARGVSARSGSSGRWTKLLPFMWGERDLTSDSFSWSGTARLWYIPTAPTLSSGGTTSWDSIMGFDEWIVLNCLVMAAAKEESDPSTFAAQLGKVEKQIMGQVQQRDLGEPDRWRDEYGEDLYAVIPYEDELDIRYRVVGSNLRLIELVGC